MAMDPSFSSPTLWSATTPRTTLQAAGDVPEHALTEVPDRGIECNDSLIN